jgi:hypothetical protein
MRRSFSFSFGENVKENRFAENPKKFQAQLAHPYWMGSVA